MEKDENRRVERESEKKRKKNENRRKESAQMITFVIIRKTRISLLLNSLTK